MKTWKEKIVSVMTGRNDRGAALWYSHAKIVELVSELEGWDITTRYRSLSVYLTELVKSGHLQRTIKPPELSKKVQYDHKGEYLYRRTSKPFKRGHVNLGSSKNKWTDAQERGRQAHDLWRMYPMYPKWYRRMMMD